MVAIHLTQDLFRLYEKVFAETDPIIDAIVAAEVAQLEEQSIVNEQY